MIPSFDLLFLLYFLAFLLIIRFAGSTVLRLRRNSSFQKLAEDFGLEVSLGHQILEGEGIKIFQIQPKSIKFIEMRKLDGALNSRQVSIQDTVGKVGGGTFATLVPFWLWTLFGGEYGGGGAPKRATSIYVNNDEVTDPHLFSYGSSVRGRYKSISDIRNFLQFVKTQL